LHGTAAALQIKQTRALDKQRISPQQRQQQPLQSRQAETWRNARISEKSCIVSTRISRENTSRYRRYDRESGASLALSRAPRRSVATRRERASAEPPRRRRAPRRHGYRDGAASGSGGAPRD